MKVLIRALVFVGVLAGFAAGAHAADLPKPPADAGDLGLEPIAPCGSNWGIYRQAYDLNPDTKAAHQEYGVYEFRDDEPKLGEPFLVIIADDEGETTVYLKQGDKVEVLTIEQVRERYPDPCKLPGVLPEQKV